MKIIIKLVGKGMIKVGGLLKMGSIFLVSVANGDSFIFKVEKKILQ